MLLLEDYQINRKTTRLAYQILENNFEKEEIFLAGINERGSLFAAKVQKKLSQITKIPITFVQLIVSEESPYNATLKQEIDKSKLSNKTIIIVDDVANSGKTLFYSLKPIFELEPSKLEIAVLIDRKHKKFPVQPDYVGLTLHTTLQEHIDVQFSDSEIKAFLN